MFRRPSTQQRLVFFVIWLGGSLAYTTFSAFAYTGPPFPVALRDLLSEQPADALSLQKILLKDPIHPTWPNRLDPLDARRLRNAIFALQGARFRSPDLQQFFSKQPWYRPFRLTASIHLSSTARSNLQALHLAEQQTPQTRPLDPPLSRDVFPSTIHPNHQPLCTRSLLHQARQWQHHHLAYFAFLKLRIVPYRRYLFATIHLSSQMYTPLPPKPPAPLPPRFSSLSIKGGKALLMGRGCTRWKVITYGTRDLHRGLPRDLRALLGL